MAFYGRQQELAQLDAELRLIRTTGEGRFILMRGRRQVGKSRLVEEFLRRQSVPSVYFQATKGRESAAELDGFTALIAASALPAAPLVRAGTRFETWDGALTVAATEASNAQPLIIVLDEIPHLFEREPSVEGALQTAWDRSLRSRPVLLIVIGSDLSIMSALTEYGRPLFGRPTKELVVAPLTPADVADALGLDAAAALDAHLVLGGFPLLLTAWRNAGGVREFLSAQLEDPTAALLVVAERALAAEFPPQAQARAVLSVIGAGERTFSAIARRSGIDGTSLARALELLASKGVIERMVPYSARASRLARYCVRDPYLRFWLRFLERGIERVQRGRGDLVMAAIEDAWPSYRGKAIEPIVREAVARLLPIAGLGDAVAVGSYWTRAQDLEIDLVGIDGSRPPAAVTFVGSIEWRDDAPFDTRDGAGLSAARSRLPGAGPSTPLLAVSRAGFDAPSVELRLGPDDLLAAWR